MKPKPVHNISVEGTASISLPDRINAVSIGNIVDVVSHEISKEAGATLHIATFRNGGSFHLLYLDDGTVKDIGGERINVTITEDDRIVICCL